jgi:hypothetical protein
MSRDTKEFRHESYGMVMFSRCGGSPGRLFGSSLSDHPTTIHLRIAKGVRRHSLNEDRFSGEGIPFVEVILSAAQFAELLTTMNVGDGVPCTISRLGTMRVPSPPQEELTEPEQIKADFGETTDAILDRMKAFRALLEKAADKMGKKDRESILFEFGILESHTKGNIPFVADRFHEATDRMVAHAKAEVDAFMTHAVMAAGMKALSERAEVPALTEGEP